MKQLLHISLMVCAVTGGSYAQSTLSVVNGARFEVRYPVSPGAYAQAYGAFTGVTATTTPAVPLPTTLDGVQVLVNDVAAPLYAVGPQAVSFIVPVGAAVGRATVRVTRAGAAIANGTADVVAFSPGVFFVLGDALAQGGVLNQSSEYAVQGAPARRGATIQIFGTGQGPVDGTVADGAVPGGGTLVRAQGTTKVFISVDEAQVTFSGLSPQFPGLWQINAVVPEKAYIAGQVPLIVTLNGVPINEVSFWVAQ